MQLFLDGTLKIIVKIDSSDGGYYAMVASNARKTKKICMPLNSFHDLNKFIDILNNEFGSGDFMFGGNVKRKDLVEYGKWLKDSFYGTGDDVIYLKAVDFIGYHKPEYHWVLTREIQLSHTKILEEQKYYVVGNQLLEYRIDLKLDLVKSFSEFLHVYERINTLAKSLKQNYEGFMLGMAFIVKSFLNKIGSDKTDTGESRFAMLFSKEKSTGKTTSLLILGNLEGVPSSNSKMASGDGAKTGTTIKPLRDVLEKTTFIVLLNDYQSNKIMDDFLLQSHDALPHGSGSSGIKEIGAGIMLTGNVHETNRNAYNFLPLVFLKGLLIAWTHRFGSAWFEDVTQQLINEIIDIILQHCKFIQIRLAKTWGSIISAYVMLLNGVKEKFDLIGLIERTIQNLRQDADCSTDISDMASLQTEILRKLTDSPDEAGQWMKINVTFTDHEMKSLPAVAVQNSLVKLFSSVSQKRLREELRQLYGSKCLDQVMDFMDPVDSKKRNRFKAIKIPEKKFSSETLAAIYEGKVMTMVMFDIGFRAAENSCKRKLELEDEIAPSTSHSKEI